MCSMMMSGVVRVTRVPLVFHCCAFAFAFTSLGIGAMVSLGVAVRKAIFLFFLLLGIGAGYLPARNDDWGLRIVMMAVGALFGGAIGGALARIGKERSRRRSYGSNEELDPIPGSDMMGRDVTLNYWRDEGHLPFTKPPRPEHGNHMFDADKNI